MSRILMYPTDGRQMRASSILGKQFTKNLYRQFLWKDSYKKCVYWKLPQDCQKLLKILFSLMVTSLYCYLFFQYASPNYLRLIVFNFNQKCLGKSPEDVESVESARLNKMSVQCLLSYHLHRNYNIEHQQLFFDQNHF